MERETRRGGEGTLMAMTIREIPGLVRAVERPLCVFDIDSTLMDTAPRNNRILREAAQAYPALAPFASRLGVRDMGYTLIDDLRRAGCADGELLGTLHSFWKVRFFSDEYVSADEPYPGAVDYVYDLHAAGATIYYLSGRDEPGMGKGTRASLMRHGFPMDDRTIMHLKPAFEMNDFRFKLDSFEDIRKLDRTVVAIFENEPANANAFKERFPEAAVFLIRTITSKDPASLRADVIPFDSFEEGL